MIGMSGWMRRHPLTPVPWDRRTANPADAMAAYVP